MTDIATPDRVRLADDPRFQNPHFVILDFEGTAPKGASPEPIKVAALGPKHEPGSGQVRSRLSLQAFIKPPAHAPITPFDVAQTGITPADVADAGAVSTVLRMLNDQLSERPLLLVAHHAPAEAGILYAYRETCPRLAYTRIVNTRLLAKHIVPGLPAYGLDAILAHCGIPQPPNRHRAMDDVSVTAALLQTLLAEASRRHQITTVTEFTRVASRTPRAAQPTPLELS